MNLLLDTHILLWALAKPKQLPNKAVKAIYQANDVLVPKLEFSSLYTSRCVIRHTRREACIQPHGRRAQIHPCSLDSGNPCRNDGL